MKLERTMSIGSGLYKEYSLGSYECIEFLKDLQKSNFQFNKVRIDEGVERDMQSVAGTYSIERVIETYDELLDMVAREGEPVFSAYGKHGADPLVINLYPREKTVALVTKDDTLEISDIVKR